MENLKKTSITFTLSTAILLAAGQTFAMDETFRAPESVQALAIHFFDSLFTMDQKRREPGRENGTLLQVFRGRYEQYFIDNPRVDAFSSDVGIHFPQNSFIADQISSVEKEKLAHEVCHQYLLNFRDPEDKRKFETEEKTALLLYFARERIALKIKLIDRLESWISNPVWNPYVFGLLNGLAKLPNQRFRRSITRVLEEDLDESPSLEKLLTLVRTWHPMTWDQAQAWHEWYEQHPEEALAQLGENTQETGEEE
ncbi:hypothetical protein ACFLX2_00145 [Candidatus Dependentiae bacterium]